MGSPEEGLWPPSLPPPDSAVCTWSVPAWLLLAARACRLLHALAWPKGHAGEALPLLAVSPSPGRTSMHQVEQSKYAPGYSGQTHAAAMPAVQASKAPARYQLCWWPHEHCRACLAVRCGLSSESLSPGHG